MTVRSCSLLRRVIEPDWSRSGPRFVLVIQSTAKHRTLAGAWQPSNINTRRLLDSQRLMRFGLKLSRRNAGLLAEIPAEIRDIGKAEPMRDLLDRHVRIHEIALCLAHEMFVDHRERRTRYLFAANAPELRDGRAELLRIELHGAMFAEMRGDKRPEAFDLLRTPFGRCDARRRCALAQARHMH